MASVFLFAAYWFLLFKKNNSGVVMDPHSAVFNTESLHEKINIDKSKKIKETKEASVAQHSIQRSLHQGQNSIPLPSRIQRTQSYPDFKSTMIQSQPMVIGAFLTDEQLDEVSEFDFINSSGKSLIKTNLGVDDFNIGETVIVPRSGKIIKFQFAAVKSLDSEKSMIWVDTGIEVFGKPVKNVIKTKMEKSKSFENKSGAPPLEVARAVSKSGSETDNLFEAITGAYKLNEEERALFLKIKPDAWKKYKQWKESERELVSEFQKDLTPTVPEKLLSEFLAGLSREEQFKIARIFREISKSTIARIIHSNGDPVIEGPGMEQLD